MSIPVPRYSTLTDVIQRVQNAEVAVPADKQLWAALLAAIRTGAGAQDPPLYLLEDSVSGESFTVNQHFARDFIERYEDERTHIITLSFPAGLRTFRAGQRFWDFLLTCYEQISMDASTKEMSELQSGKLTVTSNLLPENAMTFSRRTWVQVVETWNRRNGPTRKGMKWSQGMPVGLAEEDGDDEADTLCPSASRSGGATRPRSGAVIDPLTTLDDTELLEIMNRYNTRKEGSRYWQHFMKHWKLLQAQYRNYL